MRAERSRDDRIIRFADACERTHSLDGLRMLWLDSATLLGVSYAALGSHVDPRHPQAGAFLLHNYPSEWVDRYSALRYHLIDPVFRCAEQRSTPFLWSDPAFLSGLSWRQRRVLSEARQFGLHHGRTHALVSPFYLPASCSIVVESPDMHPEVYTEIRAISVFVHYRASQLALPQTRPQHTKVLRPRERKCLELSARGRVDHEIAEILAISVATVRRMVESARARLGVKSRAHAVAIAMATGQIRP